MDKTSLQQMVPDDWPVDLKQEAYHVIESQSLDIASDFIRDTLQRIQTWHQDANLIKPQAKDALWYSPGLNQADGNVKLVIYEARYPERRREGPPCPNPDCPDRTNTVTIRRQTRSWDEPETVFTKCQSCMRQF